MNFSLNSLPDQCAVRAVLQEPVWPPKRGNLCVALTAFVVLMERLAIGQVGVHFLSLQSIYFMHVQSTPTVRQSLQTFDDSN